MARASTPTLLSLGEFGDIMGIDPYHLNQIEHGQTAGCKDVFFQYPWQKDWLSRESMAEGIAQAEFALASSLGFWFAPTCTVNEVVQYPRPFNRTMFGYAGTPRGMWKAVQLAFKKIIGPGLCVRASVSLAVAVTYNAPTGTIQDGFTLTVPAVDANGVTITDPDEIGIYFAAADRIGDVDETWRIRPVNVTLSGGNATITGKKPDLAKPKLQMESTVPDQPLTDVAGTYVTTVDVYRNYRDDRATADNPSQGTAIWESGNCPPDCTVETTEVCLGLRNAEMGLVYAQLPNCWAQNREPDRLHVNYVSGIPRVNGRMDKQYAQIVAALACTFFPSEKCGCEWVDRIIAYWREIPPADPSKPGARQVFKDEIMDNPWGASRGARRAWDFIQNHPLRLTGVMVL